MLNNGVKKMEVIVRVKHKKFLVYININAKTMLSGYQSVLRKHN